MVQIQRLEQVTDTSEMLCKGQELQECFHDVYPFGHSEVEVVIFTYLVCTSNIINYVQAKVPGASGTRDANFPRNLKKF